MTDLLVVGVDAGATTTKCLVATADGATVIGRGVAAGANFRSSGSDPALSLTAALAAALGDSPRSRVVAGVVGMAGAASAGIEHQRVAAEQAWADAGLPGAPRVVTDLEVAFASGADSPDGLLLLAGTGAVAAAVSGFTIRHRRDGYGWLLGDEGSAVWIGLAGLKAAFAGIDGRGEPTALSEMLTRALVGDTARSATGRPEDVTQAVISVVYDRPPADLGCLARLVDEAARAGDTVAGRICRDAAERLLTSLDAVCRAVQSVADDPVEQDRPIVPAAPVDGDRPVVLAGSVAAGPGVVATLVADGVRDRFGASPKHARDGAAGAAALALRDVLPDSAAAANAHRRLISLNDS